MITIYMIYYRKMNDTKNNNSISKNDFISINRIVNENTNKISTYDDKFSDLYNFKNNTIDLTDDLKDKIDKNTKETNNIFEFNKKLYDNLGKLHFMDFIENSLFNKKYNIGVKTLSKITNILFSCNNSYLIKLSIYTDTLFNGTYNNLGSNLIRLRVFKDNEYAFGRDLKINMVGDSYGNGISGKERYNIYITTYFKNFKQNFNIDDVSKYRIEVFYYNQNEKNLISFTDISFKYTIRIYNYCDIKR